MIIDFAPFNATAEQFPFSECDNPDINAGFSFVYVCILVFQYYLENLKGVWNMNEGKVTIRETFLDDWKTLRELLVLYSDNLSLKKDTWEWMVQKADNTFVSIFGLKYFCRVTQNYYLCRVTQL